MIDMDKFKGTKGEICRIGDISSSKQLDEFDGEVFKPYPLSSYYMVSNLGRVKSIDRVVRHNYGGFATRKGIIMTQTANNSGYLSVGLTIDGKLKTTRVNRMVAITFIDNPDDKLQVNHINGNKLDNRACNLEWCTPSENVIHSWNIGLSRKQSSFMYVLNRLENINKYITYSPIVQTPLGSGTIIVDQASYRIIYDNGKIENLVKSVRVWKDNFKIALKPLSDLTKEIDGVVHLSKLEEIYPNTPNFENIIKVGTLDKFNLCETNVEHCIVDYLFQHHFDVYGLIEDGLAIDVNTLEQ